MAEMEKSAIAYQRAHVGDNKIAEIIPPTAIFLAIAYIAVFFRYKSRRVARLKIEAEYVSCRIHVSSIRPSILRLRGACFGYSTQQVPGLGDPLEK